MAQNYNNNKKLLNKFHFPIGLALVELVSTKVTRIFELRSGL